MEWIFNSLHRKAKGEAIKSNRFSSHLQTLKISALLQIYRPSVKPLEHERHRHQQAAAADGAKGNLHKCTEGEDVGPAKLERAAADLRRAVALRWSVLRFDTV